MTKFPVESNWILLVIICLLIYIILFIILVWIDSCEKLKNITKSFDKIIDFIIIQKMTVRLQNVMQSTEASLVFHMSFIGFDLGIIIREWYVCMYNDSKSIMQNSLWFCWHRTHSVIYSLGNHSYHYTLFNFQWELLAWTS